MDTHKDKIVIEDKTITITNADGSKASITLPPDEFSKLVAALKLFADGKS